jgi:hypothetical protein
MSCRTACIASVLFTLNRKLASQVSRRDALNAELTSLAQKSIKHSGPPRGPGYMTGGIRVHTENCILALVPFLRQQERRAGDSLAACQSHGMYLANLIVRLWVRRGRSSRASKVGQHFACREARRISAVSGDLGVSPSIVTYYICDPGVASK